MASEGSDEQVVAVVRGQVQGVGFRWSTRRELERLDLRGSAENLPDGTVRVLAQGASSVLDELVSWLRGPGAPGHVEHVEVERTDVGRG